jgi:hypothetical protein
MSTKNNDRGYQRTTAGSGKVESQTGSNLKGAPKITPHALPPLVRNYTGPRQADISNDPAITTPDRILGARPLANDTINSSPHANRRVGSNGISSRVTGRRGS